MRKLADALVEEDLTNQIDGQKTDFTLSLPAMMYSVEICINGLPQGLPGASFTVIDPTTVRILPFVLRDPDQLLARYLPAPV